MARGSFAGESGTNQHDPRQPTPSLLVQMYACKGVLMALSRSRAIRSAVADAQGDCEAWPYLDEGVLRPSLPGVNYVGG